jgi:SWIM zinc finger
MFITKIEVIGDSGRKYTIEVGAGSGTRCSCPDFKYRGAQRGLCKHIEYVADKVFGSRRAQTSAGTSLVLVPRD